MRALGRRPKGHEHARAESPSASKKRPGRAAKPVPASAAACRAPHPALPTAGACRFWELLRLASQFAKAAPRSRRITCVQRAAKADRVVLPRTAAGRSNAPPSAPQFCQAVRKKGTEAAPSGLRMRLARPAPCGVEIIRQEQNRFLLFLRPPLFDRTLGSPHRLAPSAACSLTFRRAGPPRKLWDGGPSDAGAVRQRRRPLRRARPRANLATKLAAQGRRPLRCPPNAVAFRPKRRKRGPFEAFGF